MPAGFGISCRDDGNNISILGQQRNPDGSTLKLGNVDTWSFLPSETKDRRVIRYEFTTP